MFILRVIGLLCIAQFAFQATGLFIGGRPTNIIRQETGNPQQNLVTWDEHSLFIRGERVLFYSGEFHPFRLPVPDLWLDVFQKIKALGYNGVSFYIDWALIEGTEGIIRDGGVFALEPFFDAASQAGIYLIARPGPYINAEVSGGGFPGWLGRIKGTLRTNATDFLSATDLYIQSMGEKIVKAQITNGGPVVLYQVENEYTYPANNITFPNLDYFDYVINQAIDAGITIPIINNDAGPLGYFAPGNSSFGNVTVDIYGHDGYPLGFDCSNPNVWPDGNLPTNYRQLHNRQSPSTPYSVIEFQGGSFDPWGGPGFGQCNKLINSQFERVFYKNLWAAGITIYNQYMIYGGTNWGNLGHPGGYTSYDYAAVIAEDRNVAREKYSEAKLEVNFLRTSPAYLTSVPNPTYINGTYANTNLIATTPIADTESNTKFYIVRHAAYNSNDTTSYRFTVPTSIGNITIPRLSTFASTLALNGRDSKVVVTDYKVGKFNLVYSSADVFTSRVYGTRTILVMYGGAGETHEFGISSSTTYETDGSKVLAQKVGNTTIVQWQVTPAQQTFTTGSLTVYLLWRNDVYNWWDVELPAASPISNYSSPSKEAVIVKGPYLVRTAAINNGGLYLTGELNATTTIQVIAAPPYNTLYFNNIVLNTTQGLSTIAYNSPQLTFPNLSSVTWKSIDTLPELSSSYSDASWPNANHTSTNNPLRPTSPNVLYASDYGFHTGPLIYRGHFDSPSIKQATTLKLQTQGGYAYGYQVYLNSSLLYTYPGFSTAPNHTMSIPLPSTLKPSTPYILTVVIDHTGLNENFNPGLDSMKEPRGILSYSLTSSENNVIPLSWKISGNLGGENYKDLSRGPLNEGGFFFERQGYHLPGTPTNTSLWSSIQGGPLSGFSASSSDGGGAMFYSTTFNLNLPKSSFDIPLQFTFTNTTGTNGRPTPIRANLYVNGWQFGKYVNNIGPQTSFPVPEGILNYDGENYLGVYLWNLGSGGEQVRLAGLVLEQSSTPTYFGVGGRKAPRLSPGERWQQRQGAY